MDKKYLEIIKFAQELVKIKSQGVIDGEKNIAKAVFDKLANFGFGPELIGDKSRPSVICRVGGVIKLYGWKAAWIRLRQEIFQNGNILRSMGKLLAIRCLAEVWRMQKSELLCFVIWQKNWPKAKILTD